MSQMPDSRTISEKLSEVLSDIGVTEKMVLKRRRTFMLMELINTILRPSLGQGLICFNFGSQSEGSTTPDLVADIDTLLGYHIFNVIQDFNEEKPGVLNDVLMLQDETTSPGYCLLQLLRRDVPLPFPGVRLDEKRIVTDGKRMLIKNTFFDDLVANYSGRNGPAHVHQGNPGCTVEDHVLALYCKSWPKEAKPWLAKQGIGGWPTEEIKRFCETTGCFLVPVGSKNGRNEEHEWRISTSQAERCLMFSLNITQKRCYILMKMILKTFINPHCSGVISSYMCKNVLFDCIQNTSSSEWVESNLYECLRHCLSILLHFVMQENCPHFIIPRNNLLKGKISVLVKLKLFAILHSLIHCDGYFLFMISTDSLDLRFLQKMFPYEMHTFILHPLPPDLIGDLISENHSHISAQLIRCLAGELCLRHNNHLVDVMDGGNGIAHRRSIIFTLVRRFVGESLVKLACTLVIPFLYTSLASAIASHDLDQNRTISPEAMAMFSSGLNSDVSSGRLKLASALYSSGNMYRTECILQDIEHMYDVKNVETICKCCPFQVKPLRQGFVEKSNTGNEELIKYITSFCVRFLPCERKCVPHELQYEMYRSTQEDMLHRHEFNDFWMDWAVVDSLPYLYFLKYKIYGQLQKAGEQQRALTEFKTTIDTEPNIGHKETALNLLGQCMEQENRHTDALNYYIRSLKIRERNNAANIHICRLLSALINKQVVDNK